MCIPRCMTRTGNGNRRSAGRSGSDRRAGGVETCSRTTFNLADRPPFDSLEADKPSMMRGSQNRLSGTREAQLSRWPCASSGRQPTISTTRDRSCTCEHSRHPGWMTMYAVGGRPYMRSDYWGTAMPASRRASSHCVRGSLNGCDRARGWRRPATGAGGKNPPRDLIARAASESFPG